MDRITPDALRWWFIPIAVIGVAVVLSLLLCRFTGVLSPEPLEQTRVVGSLKWGLIFALVLELPFIWRDHRKYYLVASLLSRVPAPGSQSLPESLRTLDREGLIRRAVSLAVKRRSLVMLGNVSAGLVMLAGLYVIMRADWLLLAMLAYTAAAAWLFQPNDVGLPRDRLEIDHI